MEKGKGGGKELKGREEKEGKEQEKGEEQGGGGTHSSEQKNYHYANVACLMVPVIAENVENSMLFCTLQRAPLSPPPTSPSRFT